MDLHAGRWAEAGENGMVSENDSMIFIIKKMPEKWDGAG